MKTNRSLFLFLSSFVVLLLLTPAVQAQKMTRITGKVIDVRTHEPLPFANVVFKGKNIGVVTDFKGEYHIDTQWASDSLQSSYMGYNSQTRVVKSGQNQTINFGLRPNNITLKEVVIKAKRIRYRNKNNPAVALIKKVIENKNLNRKENLNYYEFDKYEKDEFDLNNITEKYKQKKAFKKFQFIFNYVDTADINGKPFLPVFLKEIRSKVYYRKTPKSKKEYLLGTKMTGFHEYIDNQGVSYMIDNLYQDIDLYDNTILLMTNPFTSPISDFAPSIYKFRIIDTLDVNGYNCFKLAFQPRNKQDFAFGGNLYITNDGRYALVKADMRVSKDINLNFVNDMEIIQEYSFINNKTWMLTTDKLVVDFNLGEKGIGMFGRKSVYYDNFIFNKIIPDSLYSGLEREIKTLGFNERDSLFWKKNRLVDITEQEKNIYTMVDNVQNVPAFKRTMDVVMLLVAGYWNFNKIDVGPVSTFYSFNDVEGFRLRLGGMTSDKFSKKFKLSGFGIYGFKDKQFKYSGMATLSLNNKPLADNPKHYISAQYQYETNFPGMDVEFINEDNFLLSFKRGVADKILYNRMFNIKHYRDWKNGFSTTLILRNIEQKPGGTLYFNYQDGHSDQSITSSEITAAIRFAPNEKFYQGINFKTPIFTNQPIMQLSYTQGIKGIFGSDYSYSKLKFNVFKRFYLGPLGFTDTEIEAGKIFGKVPFLLLNLPRANQTYSYQLRSYNMMNFLEFASDEYVSLFVDHHFNGFILNKIPLLKKLKWRSVVSFKGLYGGITDRNNPEITSGLMKFPTDINGNPTTFSLEEKPYVEASVGIGNIFKFFRVDLVRRLTYLDHPDAPEYGIRVRFKFDF
ncbi:MAG: carboxypeptidase-like regulatory domain-containing protein [Bacteroidetes bacterium]|nr:MAG: carboxypeptidase-like regulatory domain-containing protein [Bacteroidota bacterium]